MSQPHGMSAAEVEEATALYQQRKALPTTRQLAKRYGVSVTTLLRYIGGRYPKLWTRRYMPKGKSDANRAQS